MQIYMERDLEESASVTLKAQDYSLNCSVQNNYDTIQFRLPGILLPAKNHKKNFRNRRKSNTHVFLLLEIAYHSFWILLLTETM